MKSLKRPFAFQVLIRMREQSTTDHYSASILEKSFFSSASWSCSQTKEIKYIIIENKSVKVNLYFILDIIKESSNNRDGKN